MAEANKPTTNTPATDKVTQWAGGFVNGEAIKSLEAQVVEAKKKPGVDPKKLDAQLEKIKRLAADVNKGEAQATALIHEFSLFGAEHGPGAAEREAARKLAVVSESGFTITNENTGEYGTSKQWLDQAVAEIIKNKSAPAVSGVSAAAAQGAAKGAERAAKDIGADKAEKAGSGDKAGKKTEAPNGLAAAAAAGAARGEAAANADIAKAEAEKAAAAQGGKGDEEAEVEGDLKKKGKEHGKSFMDRLKNLSPGGILGGLLGVLGAWMLGNVFADGMMGTVLFGALALLLAPIGAEFGSVIMGNLTGNGKGKEKASPAPGQQLQADAPRQGQGQGQAVAQEPSRLPRSWSQAELAALMDAAQRNGHRTDALRLVVEPGKAPELYTLAPDAKGQGIIPAAALTQCGAAGVVFTPGAGGSYQYNCTPPVQGGPAGGRGRMPG